MNLEHTVGLRPDGSVWLPDRHTAARSILLKLAAMGIEIPAAAAGDGDVFQLAGNLFARYREQARLLSDHLCPADRRIQHYIDELQGAAGTVRLPAETLILDQYGLARELSLPVDGDRYENELVSSYRLDNGVLHNPVNDRRTTQGVFHVAEGGLPIPADKTRVPLARLLQLLEAALRPPAELLRLPFTANWKRPVETMVSPPAAAAGLPRGAQGDGREAPGGPVLRARRSGVQPGLRREHLRQRRRPVPAGERRRARRGRLDRPHRLRHPRAPSHADPEEGPRPAHCDEPSGRHVLEETSCTTTAGRSRSPRAEPRA